jgi:hypothetical protein
MLHYLLVKIRFTTEEVYYSKPTSIVGEVSYGFLFQNWPLTFPALSGRTTQKVRAGPRVETKSEIDDAQRHPVWFSMAGGALSFTFLVNSMVYGEYKYLVGGFNPSEKYQSQLG